MGDGRDRREFGPETAVPRLIGRERELAVMARAVADPPGLVLVEGEAGVGKSRLLHEFLAGAGNRLGRVLVGACPPLREPFTLGPVVDAVRQATDRVAGLRLTALAGALRSLFPEWAADLPAAPEPLDDPSAARHRLFRALAELLDRLGVQVLVVEDAHWADDATLEFLLFLAAGRRPALSLFLTYRPEDVAPDSLLRRLSGRATRARIRLAALDAEDTGRLVSSMLDDEPVSAEFAAFLHAHTDGVPLAVEESVRLLYDRADLVHENGVWLRRDLDELDVPPSIRDAVLERTARLAPAAQAVLRAAAVLAHPAAESALLAVADLDAATFAEGVGGALESGLLREDSHGLLAFRHGFPARAVYETITASERQRYHLRAGLALEQGDRPPAARLARHFREAGRSAEWCRYAEQAAELALSSGDPKTAFTVLHEVLTRGDLPAATVARIMHTIPLYAESTGTRDLVPILRAVHTDPTLTPAERGGVGLHLGRMLYHGGDLEAGSAELERAVPDLADRPVDAAHAMIMLGFPDGTPRPAARHRYWLERAAAVEADPSIPPVHRIALLGDRASALLQLGEVAGWDVAAQLPSRPHSPQEALQVARGYANLGEAAMLWGRYDDARRWSRFAAELAGEHHYTRMRDLLEAMLAHLDWLTGDWQHADPLEDAPHIRRSVAAVDGFLDDTADAEATLRNAMRPGPVEGTRDPGVALARLYLATGRVADALRITEDRVSTVEAKGVWVWAGELAPVRVEALLAAGRAGDAAGLVDRFADGLGDLPALAAHAGLAQSRALLDGSAESFDA
ncbi:MAG TPA: AAA family ATPase, partial [Pseudonocardiaceae bacterium]|nr:AAA family ATPase [Pseudonocardiaceae bacterium]